MECLSKLNIENSIVNGKDGESFNYEYILINKKRVEINIVQSIVTGNRVTLRFESPIID